MPQQFYDHFAEANKSLQERLGSSRTTINRDSGVLSTQTRSLLQMLNYGLDSITGRAASHLLNLDLLHSNTAYLMKLCEGLLLNSIASIAPPRTPSAGKDGKPPLWFRSEQEYSKFSIIGSCSLLDGTPATLIVTDIKEEAPRRPGTHQYRASYCAGSYVQQTLPISSIDFTPGIIQSVYISEPYKTVWTQSMEVKLVTDDPNGTGEVPLTPCWSMDELLSQPSTAYVVLCQHTARGVTITLGDGEVFGEGYNYKGSLGKSPVLEVVVSYIKAESLVEADPASVSLNADVSVLGETPMLLHPSAGDSAESLRTRAVAEFFAAGKVTQPQDLEALLRKIPIVKSAHCKKEYDYPWGAAKGESILGAVPEYDGTITASNRAYPQGAIVKVSEAWLSVPSAPYSKRMTALEGVYMSKQDVPAGAALGDASYWARLYGMGDFAAAANRYPWYQVYDNATIVVTGLVLKDRYYWNGTTTYSKGTVVYYAPTNELYKALRDNISEPPDAPADGADPAWGDASAFADDPDFDEYEEMSPAMFDAEIKHCFGIWEKLGFISVAVEPLAPVACTVHCSYQAPYEMGLEIQEEIARHVCWEVGAAVSPEVLNSALTEKFSLSAVQVTIGYGPGKGPTLGHNEYVRRSGLTIDLEVINGR